MMDKVSFYSAFVMSLNFIFVGMACVGVLFLGLFIFEIIGALLRSIT